MNTHAAAIRQIGTEDLDGLSQLFVACFSAAPWNEAWTFAAAHARLARMVSAHSSRGVVAVIDGAIVGMAFGQVEGWLDGNFFLLQEFCVAPTRQNQGVGKALLSRLVSELATADGVSAVYLLTDHASPAQAIYEKFGFGSSAKKIVMGASITSLVAKLSG